MNDDITILADFDSALYEQVEPPLVSLYLPTHGSAPGDESDRIEFEALVEQARAKLAQERERREYKGVDERLAYAAEHFDDLMSPAPGGSLAVLAGNDRTYIYRLGYEAGPLAFVGERFYVKPLLKNFQFGSYYFLLGLAADRFAFVHGDFGSLERVELPRDVLDAFSEEFPLVYDGHEGALDYSSLENHMPPYHGWKSRNDVRKEEAGKFFQYVNKAVTDYLVAGTDLPVILVSLPEHQSAFRRISTIPHLLDEGIEKDIGGIEAPELLADAKAVIEHVREAQVARPVPGRRRLHPRRLRRADGRGLPVRARAARPLPGPRAGRRLRPRGPRPGRRRVRASRREDSRRLRHRRAVPVLGASLPSALTRFVNARFCQAFVRMKGGFACQKRA